MTPGNPPKPRRWLLRGILGLVAFGALLVAAAYLAGRQARASWQRTYAELLAGGRILPLVAVIPPPIPETENFAAIPLLQGQGRELTRDLAPGEIPLSYKFDPFPGLDLKPADPKASFYNFNAWNPDLAATVASLRTGPLPAGETPAATILRLLEDHRPTLDALAEGALRSQSRFPARYDHGFRRQTLNVMPFRHAALLYILRATARIEAGDAAGAARDVVTLLRFGRHFRTEPSNTIFMMGGYFTGTVAAPLRYGCQRRVWTEAELAALEREMAGVDLVAEFWRATQAHESLFLADADRSFAEDFAKARSPRAILLDRLGYWMLEDFARGKNELLVRLPRQRSQLAEVESFVKYDEQLESQPEPWYGTLGNRGLVGGARTLQRVAAGQARLEMCLAAVRLERIRLRDNRYPAITAGLELPTDLFSGAPLSYEASADGARFRLAGSGWDIEPRSGQEDPMLSPWRWYSDRQAVAGLN